MTFRPIFCALMALSLASCQTPYKKADAEEKKPMQDQSGDQAFQSFLGRLRIAVRKKDEPMLTSLMTTDFGYRWDTPPPGESIFQYWSLNNLWPVLEGLLQKKFVAKELYMVAPAEAATDPNYKGYRVGMRIVRGSWKFAYFVPAEGAQ